MAGRESMPRMKLGSQGLEVSKLGYGCMGLTGVYNDPVSEEDGIAIIKEAFNKGITHFDTADIYGIDYSNEYLALKQLPREKVELSTKFGMNKRQPMTIKGSAEYARSCCEASLKRLQVDFIDLYYIHRIDTTVPIEETMGELKKMVEEGKVKYIGLSEASAETVRRAHAVHPITAYQMEYSLWSREVEDEIIPVCRELGIGIVAYGPIARGFFGGKKILESLPKNSYLNMNPRFTGENWEKNKTFYFRVDVLAIKHSCTPAQLALAWINHQGDDITSIPGTTKIKNLHENIGSVKVKLTIDEVQELSNAVPTEEVAGNTQNDALRMVSWRQESIPRMKLGSQGFEVSKLGYGCMGLSGVYNDPVSEEDGIAIIKEAFDKGITHFDTSDIYGIDYANEYLVGKALKQLPREKVELATKFGLNKLHPVTIKGSAEYARSCCEASLKRLQVDYIDLYYIHRIDTTVPIEETMGELKKMVGEGKVKYVGISEASADTVRRAHAVHPITAYQMEYSLWSRDVEDKIIPVCRELGIGIVAYAPVAHGFFGGKKISESLPKNSYLNMSPRFTGENWEKNKAFYFRVDVLAKKHGCTPAQLALAWINHQGDDITSIPGTTKIKNLHENIGSVKVKLTIDEVQELSNAVPTEEVAGNTQNDAFRMVSWRFANTPQPKVK
ncbi:hypothetical protein RD792_010388 [Penstemon davidsonii]|uniref:NADP-dependent oxidoreductase domain-containing protein n=1 Tax=Penstemon davidsonii TaxID=160366 RepID=A0ABR0D347_9LAMI|nr:hypothetical protein RD792_010388 [Penstemon davidsonii]